MLSPKQFEYYSREKRVWESRGHSMSFTDLWGLIIEYFLNQEVREQEVTIYSSHPLHPRSLSTLFFCLTPILLLG